MTTTADLPVGHNALETQTGCAGRDPNLRSDQRGIDTHRTDVAADQAPVAATDRSTPRSGAPLRDRTTGDQITADAQTGSVAGATLPVGQQRYDTQATLADRVHLLRSDQTPVDTQDTCAAADPTTGDQTASAPHRRPVAGSYLPAGQAAPDSHPRRASGGKPPGSQKTSGAHGTGAAGTGDDQRWYDAQIPTVAPEQPVPATDASIPRVGAPVLADPLLALAADVLDDLERVRIANENRLRQLTRTEVDSDGEERGFGLDPTHPDVARLAALVGALRKAEHDAELNLCRLLRQHPLGRWMKAQKGIGEKQGARLLAAIGDPYWNTLHNRPRTVSELWSYAGYHVLPAGQDSTDAQSAFASGSLLRSGHEQTDTQNRGAAAALTGNPDQVLPDPQRRRVGVAATRARGQRANWSATAKMRAYLIAESCMKAGGPYREVYDAGRTKYASATHQVECRRCGPAGHPAPVGSPLSAGHQHTRALRLVAKTILRDLWDEARRLHGGPWLPECDCQPSPAPSGSSSTS